MNNGYGVKSLADKLGYRPGETVCLINAPDSFKTYLDNRAINTVVKPPADWCHAFFDTSLDLIEFRETFNLNLVQKGLWVSWPKQASGVKTDLSEQSFRDMVLPLGWVDTKVCAIDDTWSGLKFLRRKV